jgi:hypothetical protein
MKMKSAASHDKRIKCEEFKKLNKNEINLLIDDNPSIKRLYDAFNHDDNSHKIINLLVKALDPKSFVDGSNVVEFQMNFMRDFASILEDRLPSAQERQSWTETIKTVGPEVMKNFSNIGNAGQVISDAAQTVADSDVVTQCKHASTALLNMYTIYTFASKPTKFKAFMVLISFITSFYILESEEFFKFFSNIISFVGDSLIKIFDLMFGGSRDENGSPDLNMENVDDVQFQSPDYAQMVYDSILAFYMATMLPIMGGKGLTDTKKIESLLRSARSMPEFLNRISDHFIYLYNKSISHQLGWDSIKLKIDDPDVQNFDERVDDLQKWKYNGELTYTKDNLAIVEDLIRIGEKLYTSLPNKNYDSVKRLVFDKLNEIKKIRQEFLSANISLSGFRQEPVGLLLMGGPGLQKSSLLEHFAAAANAMSLNSSDFESFKKTPSAFNYNRQAENKYWDGYSPKTNVVMFDDFGQARDVVGDPDNEYMGIIRAINQFEMNLHSANLEAKGKNKFRAKFVLANTNLTRVNAVSIVSNEALIRRFGLKYIVTPKKEFTTVETIHNDVFKRKLDYSLIPKDENGTTNPVPSHFSFHEVDVKCKPTGQVFTFDDIVQFMRKSYEDRSKWKELHELNFNKTANECREMFFPTKKVEFQAPSNFNSESDIKHLKFNKYPLNPSWESPEEYTARLEDIKNNHNESIPHRDIFLADLINRINIEEKRIYDVDVDGTIEDFVREKCNNLRQLSESKISFYESFTEVSIHNVTDDPTRNSLFHEVGKVSPILSNRMKLQYKNPTKNFSITQLLDAQFDGLGTEFSNLVIELNLAYSINENYSLEKYFNTNNSLDSSNYYLAFLIYYHDADSFRSIFLDHEFVCEIFEYIPLKFLKPNKPFVGGKRVYDSIIEVASKGFEVLKSLTTYIIEFLKKPIVVLSISLASIAGVIFKFFTGEKDTKLQMYYDNPARAKSKVAKMTIKEAKESMMMQSADISGFETLNSVNNKNVFDLFIKTDEEEVWVGLTTCIKTSIGLIPRHFFDLWVTGIEEGRFQHKSEFIVRDLSGLPVAHDTLENVLKSTSELSLIDSHAALIKFNHCRSVRDITNRFITENQLTKLKHVFDICLKFPKDSVIQHTTAHVEHCKFSADGVDYSLPKTLVYAADSKVGDCGTPIYLRSNTGSNRRLMGIHFAGAKISGVRKAYAGLVTYESLLECLTDMGPHDVQLDDLDEFSELELQAIPPHIKDKYTIVGKSEHNHDPYGATKIRASPLNGMKDFHISKEFPALLRPRNGIDPFEIAMTKYCTESILIDPALLERCHEDYFCFLNSLRFSTKEILSTKVALWGDDDIEYLDAIKSDSSVGYPLKYDLINIKYLLLGDTAIRDETNPYFENFNLEIESIISDAKEGKRRLWVFTDNLKDERRPIEKVKAGKTRLFNGGPLEYLVVCKKYFGSFSKFMFERSIDNGSCIAINPLSADWHCLATRLGRFSRYADPNVGAGDFSGFDGSEQPQIHNIILDIINEWYDDGEVNATIRTTLWQEVVNSRHIFSNVIYEWPSSLPSGHPLTIIINCMYNHIAFRYCFFKTFPKENLVFNECVELQVTGDDNIFSVHDRYSDQFNELALPTLMAECGLKYTTELKGKAVKPWRKLTEVNFLKRSFRFEKIFGCYVGPLDLSSILEIPCWTKKANGEEIFYDNLNVFIRELSIHDTETFNYYAKAIRKSLSSKGIDTERTQLYKSKKVLMVHELGFKAF